MVDLVGGVETPDEVEMIPAFHFVVLYDTGKIWQQGVADIVGVG